MKNFEEMEMGEGREMVGSVGCSENNPWFVIHPSLYPLPLVGGPMVLCCGVILCPVLTQFSLTVYPDGTSWSGLARPRARGPG